MDTTRQERFAENESVFRDVNERVEESHERFGAEGLQEFLCECGDEACTERIFLTLEEYEAVRRNPTRFALVPGHEIEDVEEVVERTDRFAVVEKTGLGRRVAEERDPRRRNPSEM